MTANAGTPRGLEGVVAARTRMSHVDGVNGVLIIGGYSVEELAAHAGLEAAAHLLWRGRLPDRVELRELTSQMAEMRQLSPLTLDVLHAAKSAPPIDALRMGCATLSLGPRRSKRDYARCGFFRGNAIDGMLSDNRGGACANRARKRSDSAARGFAAGRKFSLHGARTRSGSGCRESAGRLLGHRD